MLLKERILKKLRKIYREKHGISSGLIKSLDKINISVEQYNTLLSNAIKTQTPFMVSRFGSAEINWFLNYKILSKNILWRYKAFITLEIDDYIKEKSIINDMTFLPTNIQATSNYIREVDSSIPQIDVLGSWLYQEQSSVIKFQKNTRFIYLGHLEPYYSNSPWSTSLKGKKVLVIHPMKSSIEAQYRKREKIFSNTDILPEFTLEVLQAPYFDDPRFGSWGKIMEFYKKEVLKYNFDVAILGCGSWGMPLAAYIKKMGKVSVHLGGSTQLLFGIIGSRWETLWPEFRELNLVNEHWVRPQPEETPNWASGYDKNSYW
jgi:hypothetical protein